MFKLYGGGLVSFCGKQWLRGQLVILAVITHWVITVGYNYSNTTLNSVYCTIDSKNIE